MHRARLSQIDEALIAGSGLLRNYIRFPALFSIFVRTTL